MEHHLTYRSCLVNFEKFSSKELYGTLISLRSSIPTSQNYLNNKCTNRNLNWKNICSLPCKGTLDSDMRFFQYKILNNIFYPHKKLFLLGKSTTFLCSLFEATEEAAKHAVLFVTIPKTY